MKKIGLNLLLGIAFLTLSTNVVAAADPRLTLSPTSGTYNVGDTFKVTIGIDSGTQIAGAADIVGTFDLDKLEITSIDTATDMIFNANSNGASGGGVCMASSNTEWASGKFSDTCYSNITAGDTTVKGNLIVVTFKAKATGTANVNFTCNSQPGDSNVVQSATAKDIIVCSANDSGSYTIVSSGAVASTPTPTATAITTTTATELPKTGGIASTLGLIVFGAVSLASAFFLKFLWKVR